MSDNLVEERQPYWLGSNGLVNVGPNVGQARIKAFLCPSDDANESPRTMMALNATFLGSGWDWGTNFGVGDGTSALLGRTNYLGVAGLIGDEDNWVAGDGFWSAALRFNGIMRNRSRLTLGQLTVQDGTSNTLMFGEGLGGNGVGQRMHVWSWMGVGTMSTGYGLGRANMPCINDAPPALGANPTPGQDGAHWYRFSSNHAAGVQFCFGDGSVRLLKYGSTTQPTVSLTSDWAILQQLGGKRDGLSYDTNAVME